MRLFRKENLQHDSSKVLKIAKAILEQQYTKGIECNNCGNIAFFTIKRGLLTQDFAEKTKCKICGCYLDGLKRERKRASRGSVQ